MISGVVIILDTFTFHACMFSSKDYTNEEIHFQDTLALGTVSVRLCGYTAMVKVKGKIKKGTTDFRDIVIDDLPDGGANALNLNRSVHPSRFQRICLFLHIIHVRIKFSILLCPSLAFITF